MNGGLRTVRFMLNKRPEMRRCGRQPALGAASGLADWTTAACTAHQDTRYLPQIRGLGKPLPRLAINAFRFPSERKEAICCRWQHEGLSTTTTLTSTPKGLSRNLTRFA